MKDYTDRIKSQMKNRIAYAYVFLMLIVIPLYLHNAYFDLVQAKAKLLHAALMLCLFLVLADFLLNRRLRKEYSFIEVLLLLFAALSLLSSYFSASFAESFFGSLGWGIGSLVIAGSIYLVLYLSDVRLDHRIWVLTAVVNAFLFVLSFFHSAEIDIFDLHIGIAHEQYFTYFSLLGNANWIAGYLNLLLPVLFFAFVREDNKHYRTIFLISVLAGVGNIVLSSSDGYYIGLAVCIIFGVPYLLKRLKQYRSFLLFPTVLGVFLLLVTLLPCFRLKSDNLSGLTGTLAAYGLPYLLIGCGIMMYVLSGKYTLSEKAVKILSVLVVTICVLFFVCLGYDLYVHIRSYDYFWGNNRLRIWVETMNAYRLHITPLRRIVGVGPEMQSPWYGYLIEELEAVFLATHSEPVQILFTLGIAGLLLYLLMIGCFAGYYFRKKITEKNIPYFLGIAGYLGQSLINSMNPLNAGIFFVLVLFFLQETEL